MFFTYKWIKNIIKKKNMCILQYLQFFYLCKTKLIFFSLNNIIKEIEINLEKTEKKY